MGVLVERWMGTIATWIFLVPPFTPRWLVHEAVNFLSLPIADGASCVRFKACARRNSRARELVGTERGAYFDAGPRQHLDKALLLVDELCCRHGNAERRNADVVIVALSAHR